MPFQVKEATALARRIHAGAVYTAADKKTNKRKIQRKKKVRTNEEPIEEVQ